MRELAILKIGLRTMFVFPNALPPHEQPLDRHWLSYPVTKHSTKKWGGNLRLPNSLRFKVCPDRDDPDTVAGLSIPCAMQPAEELRTRYRCSQESLESSS